MQTVAEDGYFESYAHPGIHQSMLSCRRTDAYLKALTQCADQINGAAVLDVGCGTGILSLACVLTAV